MNGDRSSTLRVALIGMGRMGRAIDALAADRGIDIVARIDRSTAEVGIDRETLRGADVAIEFSVPSQALANVRACIAAGCPVVVGTTGWDADRPALERLLHTHDARALWSPNFSIGVQLFLAIAAYAARQVGQAHDFDIQIVETHHSGKRDAPSGTAIAIAHAMEPGVAREVDISSIRIGAVPGTHEVLFDGAFEQIALVHTARDRRVFADGAITAARWLAAARPSGLYSMRDVLQPSQE